MPAVNKPRKKLRKPRWMHVSLDGTCPARCDDNYGIKTVRIRGYPTGPAKVQQLAKWFTAAAAWLKQEGE